jgi:hypothetical protein
MRYIMDYKLIRFLRLKTLFTVFVVILLIAFLLLSAGCVFNKSAASATSQPVVKPLANNALKEINSENRAIVDKISPSVVNIEVVLNQKDSTTGDRKSVV